METVATWNGLEIVRDIDSVRSYTTADVFWEDIIGPAYRTPVRWWNDQDFYNFNDLDRVENNTAHVAQILSEYRAEVIEIITVTNRDTKRFEFADSMNRIEGNIKLLADKFYAPTGWQQPKLDWVSQYKFDWRDANRLEQNLVLLKELIEKVVDSIIFCGTFACGEEVL